jgi:alpha-ketoglutarate-dependent taurine dioxygenase
MLDWIPDHKNHYTLKLTDSRSLTPVLEHPATGEPVWFGGVDLAHKGLFLKRNTHIDGEGKFSTRSFDVRYGDGQPISCTDINHITEAIEKNIKTVAMKPGDAVFLDNIFTMHGRRPFNGTRKHAVVWFSD